MADDTDLHGAVVIERMVEAPAAFVWKLWTDPDEFAKWYGPGGATVSVREMDVRVGGSRFVGMEVDTPGGARRMWFIGEHREVNPDERLVYTESIADENGTVLSPAQMGMPADHPATTEVTVELEDLGPRTRMVMTHRGIPADSPGAAGWHMAFDKMATLVATT
jgi:uncharacterized protein YndB with AHSA1/START domain